jgi:murein DD-endopeptidase MepM/ murein hydrolase activator NlpD
MRGVFAFLLLFLLLAGGCSRLGRTSVPAPAPPAQSTPSATTRGRFVTPRARIPDRADRSPAAAGAPAVGAPADSGPERIEPIHFPEFETLHVRVTRYDPFDGADRLAIDLDALARHFHYPQAGALTSAYGMRGRSMHTGIDLQAAAGDTIRAALGGVVRMSMSYSDYGNTVVVRHPCGLETVYAHHARNLVRPDDIVQAGDPIGLAGRTGRASGVHLHFEVRVTGEHFDPGLLLDTDRRTIRGGTLWLTRGGGRIVASRSAPRENYVERAAPDLAPSVAAPSVAAPPADSPAAAGVHEVRRGDTLFSISRRYGVPVDRLCSLNGISREGILSIGQKIKLN